MAVLDLYLRCLSSKPQERPTATDIVDCLSMHPGPSRSTSPTFFMRPSPVTEDVRTNVCL